MKYVISVLMLIFMFLFTCFTFGDILSDLKFQKTQKKKGIKPRKNSGIQVNNMYYRTR